MIRGIDHLQLAMPAGEEARAGGFYGEIPGFREIAKPERLAARGGLWYGLPDGRQVHLGVDAQFQPSTRGHPAFAVEAERLDGLFARLDALEGAPQWDEALAPRRRFYAWDPFGNRLEFIEVEATFH